MRVVWTKLALTALEAEGDYIAQDNPNAAYRVMQTLRESTEALATHPYIGRIGRVESTRELVIPDLPYILPYRVIEDRIEILYILHIPHI